MKTIITLFLLSLSVSAQTFTVTDGSPSDSPITLRGTVRIDPDDTSKNACFVTGHNSSAKTVVAWRMDIAIDSPEYPEHPMQWKYRHDGFFEDQIPMSPNPSSDYDPLDMDCSILTGGFHSKTLWVQFIDGSMWGAPDAAAYMMAQRTNALDFLNALKSAYSTGGEAAFQQVLSSYTHEGQLAPRIDDRRTEAFTTKLRLTQMNDTAAELVEINRMLSVASTRADWLK